jgi:hypothetical protein
MSTEQFLRAELLRLYGESAAAVRPGAGAGD